MYKIFFILVLLSNILLADEFTAIITDSYIKSKKVKKETIKLVKYKMSKMKNKDKLVVYDISKNQALIVIDGYMKNIDRSKVLKKFSKYISLGEKKNVDNKHFAKALQNAIDFINGSNYNKNTIYVFGSFYENSGNLNLKEGYPSDGCLSNSAENDFIHIDKVNKPTNIHIFYKKLKQETEYARFFHYLSLRLNSTLYSFNNNFKVSKYSQKYSKFRKDERICKVNKKVVERINLQADDCKLISSGKTINFKCSNALRKNTIITYKHNNHTYTTTANKYGDFEILVNTVNGRNTIELVTLENKTQTIYAGDFLYKSKDKLKCNLKDDNLVLIKGRNDDRKINSKVEILYNGKKFIGYTNNSKEFSLEIPIYKKDNMFEVIQPDGGREYCSVTSKNVNEKDEKASDILHAEVDKLIATIWVDNVDRHKGEEINYKYNDYNSVTRSLKSTSDGRLYFLVPLEANAVTHRITTDKGGYVDISNPNKLGFVRVTSRWFCKDADFDLYIIEPDGYTLKSLDSKKRKHFGKINIDSLRPKNGPEVYTLDLAKAPKGEYKIYIKFYNDQQAKFCGKECTGIIEINNNGNTQVETVIFDPVECIDSKPVNKKKRTYPSSREQYFKFKVGE